MDFENETFSGVVRFGIKQSEAATVTTQTHTHTHTHTYVKVAGKHALVAALELGHPEPDVHAAVEQQVGGRGGRLALALQDPLGVELEELEPLRGALEARKVLRVGVVGAEHAAGDQHANHVTKVARGLNQKKEGEVVV